ncbi:hypothetical protein B0H14DRAFT_2629140 [Mycena olivaceomarginata]|nr:hypothetical protein B0H14DRAFT_2629140 [Mycena olivaceomarginata]
MEIVHEMGNHPTIGAQMRVRVRLGRVRQFLVQGGWTEDTIQVEDGGGRTISGRIGGQMVTDIKSDNLSRRVGGRKTRSKWRMVVVRQFSGRLGGQMGADVGSEFLAQDRWTEDTIQAKDGGSRTISRAGSVARWWRMP